jgi:hypothetical protein
MYIFDEDEILTKYAMEEFGKPYTLELDVRTRCSSLVAMLERFLKLKNCFQKALIDLKSWITFSNAKFDAIQDLVSLCWHEATLFSADVALNSK